MADREWFEVGSSSMQYPNLESASEAAEGLAMNSDDEVNIYRMTTTLVRCYQRTVTVTAEDVVADDAAQT